MDLEAIPPTGQDGFGQASAIVYMGEFEKSGEAGDEHLGGPV
jgi:hypothetical protein